MRETCERPLLDRFQRAWNPNEWCGITTLVGVSGGPDSTALLRLMSALRSESSPSGQLIVAHFDHQWRADSAMDAAFVAELAQSLELPCLLGSTTREIELAGSDFCPAGSEKSEQRARQIRYHFLKRSAKEQGARFLTVAHTADDQVETILHNILRGTGLRGVGGMQPVRRLDESLTLVRPLLRFHSSDLTQYLSAIGQSFRIDPANRDLHYTRSKIRHELLPKLREFNEDVESSLLRLGLLAAEVAAESRQIAIERLDAALVRRDDRCAVMALDELKRQPPRIVREVFVELWGRQAWPQRDMSFAKWQSLVELVTRNDPQGMPINLPGKIVARRLADGCLELREV